MESNETILNILGFDQVELVSNDAESHDKDCIYIYRDKGWVHLMDNFYYTQWHSKNFKNGIKELSNKYEIFTCRLEDVDDSYDFNYYKDGKLIREFESFSPNFSDVIIEKNIGRPLRGEVDFLNSNDVFKPLVIVKYLGIALAKTRDDIVCYKVSTNQ